MGNLNGLMEGNTLVAIKMTSNMDMECIHGRMENSIKGIGRKGNSMGLGRMWIQREMKKRGNGKMVKEFHGIKKIRKKINNDILVFNFFLVNILDVF